MSELTIKWEVSVQEAEKILDAMQVLPMKDIALTHARLWQSSKEQWEAFQKEQAEAKPEAESQEVPANS